MMEGLRWLSGVMGLIFLAGGYWIAGRFDTNFGHTAFIAGAILIAAMLISAAIVERNRRG
jgi:hypothetical protein